MGKNSSKQTYTQLMEWLETVKRPKKSVPHHHSKNKVD
jgi:hypothetical protein